RVAGVRLADGALLQAPAVVLTTGTFLGGRLFAGEWEERGGRYGERAAGAISASLAGFGIRLGRHKTGTPPRLARGSIDFARLEQQHGDDPPQPFSFRTRELPVARAGQMVCWHTHTNATTHAIIREHAHLSPMFQGRIQGTGPRYCPSVEDKVVRFADKQSHLIFLEPEGRDSDEIYPNGISTSLPAEVQERFLRTIAGLEEVRVLRPGYAVEYDYVITDQIRGDLQIAALAGLFAAGQINGTSGYEEAAGQGLVAGVNAARFAQDEAPVVIDRATAYLGVMIDDLCRVNPTEPYRMFTSRAEFRLLLRSDNADRRLLPLAQRLGLVDAGFAAQVAAKEQRVRAAQRLCDTVRRDGRTLTEWLRRPEVGVEELEGACESLAAIALSPAERSELEAEIKYAGYIARQEVEVARLRRLEHKRIPPEFDYALVPGLSAESRQRLSQRRPLTLGEASRVQGVRQPDVQLLLVLLQKSDWPKRSPDSPDAAGVGR
ncbi:MAG: tRNA uridine-5-carboxymethylaminomethyl(34) synthesis enzyme MnmG, partial [Planctomycetes bacterium]|nr:tRNA uridine-5-carboxymethylaminomethyl(34) synthesis enzyme MnmG [Planctomycetota bacterium]